MLSRPKNIGQARYCASKLNRYCKKSIFLLSHIKSWCESADIILRNPLQKKHHSGFYRQNSEYLMAPIAQEFDARIGDEPGYCYGLLMEWSKGLGEEHTAFGILEDASPENFSSKDIDITHLIALNTNIYYYQEIEQNYDLRSRMFADFRGTAIVPEKIRDIAQKILSKCKKNTILIE